MNRVLYALLALALCIAAYGQRGKSHAEAIADQAEHRADSLYNVVLIREEHRRQDSLAAIAKIERATSSRDSAISVARKAGDLVPNLVTRVIQVAGDSAEVLAAVAELEEAHSVEVAGLRSALAFSDSIIAAKDLQLRGLYSANQALRSALEASRNEAVQWERAAKPKIRPSLAFGLGIVATVVTVVVLR